MLTLTQKRKKIKAPDSQVFKELQDSKQPHEEKVNVKKKERKVNVM